MVLLSAIKILRFWENIAWNNSNENVFASLQCKRGNNISIHIRFLNKKYCQISGLNKIIYDKPFKNKNCGVKRC